MEINTWFSRIRDGIKNKIKAINGGKENHYGKDYMEIKFSSANNLPLNKPLKFMPGQQLSDLFLKKAVNSIRKFFRRHFVWIIRISQYKKIDVSEEINTNKTSASKKCMPCNSCCFKDVGYKFEPNVCNKCIVKLMTDYELKNIAMLNVKEVDFRCIFGGISRDEAINRLNNSVLEDKVIS